MIASGLVCPGEKAMYIWEMTDQRTWAGTGKPRSP